MELKQGTTFAGRYTLVQEKGRGSFGEVWLAKDNRLDGIDVAIKIYIALDDRGVEEFKSEFKNAYNLNHPNLLHATYFDTEGHHPYLVMPYCPSSATELVGKCDERLLWKFIADVTAGLSYLHDMGVVHHDIKPDNILRTESGTFVITDFGISTSMRSTFRRSSMRENVYDSLGGALPYMGPEMFSGQPLSINATDIWALGATLYELATGELPFLGQGGAMLSRGAEIPDVKGPYSDDLKKLIKDCLACQTWDRPLASAMHDYAVAKCRDVDAEPAPTKLMLGNGDTDATVAVGVKMNVNDDIDPRRTRPISGARFIQSPVQAEVKKPTPGPVGNKPKPTGKMNLFVVLWLCFGIGIMLGVLTCVVVLLLDRVPSDKVGYLVTISFGIVAAMCIVGLCMMIRKSKVGFWLFSCTPVFALVGVSMLVGLNGWIIMDILLCVLAIVSTFCITLIRRDGVSAWKLMTYKHLGGWVPWTVGAVIIAGLFFVPSRRASSANSAYPEYQAACEKVDSIISSGNTKNYKPLLQALDEISEISDFEDRYYYDGRFGGNYDELASKLKRKASAAVSAWSDIPRIQRGAGNSSYAAEVEADLAKLKRANDL